MNLISIDLELNQNGKPEIIELGYVIFNVKKKEILLEKSILVNPNQDITPFITELTGITTEEVKKSGTLLRDAYDIMVADMTKYHVSRHPVQWGTDHFELRNALLIEWEDYIFRRRGHDIKSFYQLYTMATSNSKTKAGLEKAMEKIGLHFEGKPHRAAVDAKNTAILMMALQDKFIKFSEIEKILKT